MCGPSCTNDEALVWCDETVCAESCDRSPPQAEQTTVGASFRTLDPGRHQQQTDSANVEVIGETVGKGKRAPKEMGV